jgi:hypothetical protein
MEMYYVIEYTVLQLVDSPLRTTFLLEGDKC